MHNLDNSTGIALAARRAERLGLTQCDIAKALNASQSQVSRIFSGKTSATSKLATDICNYVYQSAALGSRERVALNDDLMEALASIWDGTPGHGKALAVIIRSLGLLERACAQPTGEKT